VSVDAPPVPLTWIDPETMLVELPLRLSMEWFDNLRNGVVGIISLHPSDGGVWTLHIGEAQGALEVALSAKKKAEEESDGD
jgi:hypothetical protein